MFTFSRSAFLSQLPYFKRAGLLTAEQVLIAEALAKQWANGVTGKCWPALETIAGYCACSVRTVSRAIKKLRAVGLLEWRRRWCRWNRCETNVYSLRTWEVPVEKAPEQKELKLDRGYVAKLSNGSDFTDPRPPAPPKAPVSEGLEAALARMAMSGGFVVPTG